MPGSGQTKSFPWKLTHFHTGKLSTSHTWLGKFRRDEKNMENFFFYESHKKRKTHKYKRKFYDFLFMFFFLKKSFFALNNTCKEGNVMTSVIIRAIDSFFFRSSLFFLFLRGKFIFTSFSLFCM